MHPIKKLLEILQALDMCIKAGKIRYCGLSDDTPWGINTYLKLSQLYTLPKMVSIQNEFSLLHAKDWPYLIENCVRENVAYLPWSPLAGGILSGKYLNGNMPYYLIHYLPAGYCPDQRQRRYCCLRPQRTMKL